MRDVVIVSAVRTAIGKFGGALKDVPAIDLGAIVIKEALNRANLKSELVDEVVMGNVIQAGQGQNVARHALINAGLPLEVPGFTLNMVCGSGLRAVSLAAQMIRSGEAEIIVAGGMENMSASPYILPTTRWGQRMGNGEILDSLLQNALNDSFEGYHMGITAENIAEQWGLTREVQDEFAAVSQQRAEAAIKAGKFKDEIVPVVIKTKKGDIVFEEDEYPRFGTTKESLGKLKPAFKKRWNGYSR